MTPLPLLQKVDVAKKIAEAPDNGYEIGYVIGSYLPYVVLVALAYWLYYRAKKRSQNQ